MRLLFCTIGNCDNVNKTVRILDMKHRKPLLNRRRMQYWTMIGWNRTEEAESYAAVRCRKDPVLVK